ncbi:MAG: hypothetical protein IOC90_12780 [Methylocystis sp.]|nr:hypothetical protein [Methylocystis sp.]MCA3583031.1 hypothetical protein [Methylocystis sp.]MCA3588889.1 hypothetical protein [Methylocystis sp.]MCA3590436.1 hypothetical protein [Methylocystis sp.]
MPNNKRAPLLVSAFAAVCITSALAVTSYTSANAQAPAPTPTPLSAYVDANGFIDVQKLTCDQLANTYQEDADMLAAWYSGWYNGLARKHFMDVKKGARVEHEVIVFCKANRDKKIIEALAVVFKDERARLGIEMK